MRKVILAVLTLFVTLFAALAQEAVTNRVDSLLLRSRHTEALKIIRSAIADRPDDLALRCKLGDVLAEVGDTRGAIAAYKAILHLYEPQEILQRKLAHQYYRLGEYLEATEYLHRIFERGDSTFVDCDLAGRALTQSLDSRGAIVFQRKAYNLVPQNSANVLRLVNNFGAVSEPDSVLHYTSVYLDKDSTHMGIRGVRALTCYNLHRVDSAYQDYKVLYAQGDRSPNTLFYYGLCLSAKREIVEAKRVLQLADTLADGKNVWVVLELGKLYQDFPVYKDVTALDYYRRAEELLAPDPTLLMKVNQGMAYALVSKDRFADSIKYWEAVLKVEPDNPQATYALGMVYSRLKNRKMERRYYERFVTLVESQPRIRQQYSSLVENVKERVQKLKEDEFMQRK